MSPRAADPSLRRALIDRAAAILAEEGQAKLTLRRLTRDVGVSTMAVYTHFGSMEQLRVAISDEGFRRLAAHLASVRKTKDPSADLRALGEAYVANARENPNLYRAMFFDPLPAPPPEMAEDWMATFQVLVAAVQRWLDEGRGAAGDAEEIATVLWAGEHGLVALELSGLLQPAQTDAGLERLADSVLGHEGKRKASRR
jgi:AcrR family transcriptional regulator